MISKGIIYQAYLKEDFSDKNVIPPEICGENLKSFLPGVKGGFDSTLFLQ